MREEKLNWSQSKAFVVFIFFCIKNIFSFNKYWWFTLFGFFSATVLFIKIFVGYIKKIASSLSKSKTEKNESMRNGEDRPSLTRMAGFNAFGSGTSRCHWSQGQWTQTAGGRHGSSWVVNSLLWWLHSAAGWWRRDVWPSVPLSPLLFTAVCHYFARSSSRICLHF